MKVQLIGPGATPLAIVTTTAPAVGAWVARLGVLPPGGPFSMNVTNLNTKQTINVLDVLVGDLWMVRASLRLPPQPVSLIQGPLHPLCICPLQIP